MCRSREPVCLGYAPSRTCNSADRRPVISVRPDGGGWFCYLGPLVYHRLHRLAIYVYLMGGGGVDTWSPSRTPDFSVYVCPGGYYINMVTVPLMDYVDNLILVLVMEE